MANLINVWIGKYKLNVLLVLVIVTAAAGLALAKQNGSFDPQPLSSSADVEASPPHWPHSQLPFNLPVVNSSASHWRNHIGYSTNNWEFNNIVSYSIRQGMVQDPENPSCQIYPEAIHFCSWDYDHEISGIASYGVNESGHIVEGLIWLNDKVFGPRNTYGTTMHRNYSTCALFGWVLGLEFRETAFAAEKTCMERFANLDYADNSQQPDQVDFTNLELLYDHKDHTSSTAVSYPVAEMNEHFQRKDFGQLIKILNNGQQEIYELDLDHGYKMVTTIIKTPTK